MTHRGPDDAGVYVHRNAGLGHRRLSIIDLAGGHQPMSNEDQTIWITFNGEIYNYRELADFLVQKGHTFRTRSDSETIIHLYEQLGPSCVERLNGMFAFGIWDQKAQRLFLARDRMGVKPLFYWLGDASIVFASEIKALLAYPPIQPTLNLEALPEYFAFRYLGGERTLFTGIRSLEPGHTLLWEQGNLRLNKYWFMRFRQEEDSQSIQDRTEELDRLLGDSVRIRLMSEVPLGTYCSGGVDSSLITAYAARQNGNTLNTFSVGFEEPEFDESSYARKVSTTVGTAHHQLVVTERTFADTLPQAVWLLDSPLNHANSVPLYLLSRLAKQTVTVMLTGEGSDELFGGYPRYRLLTGRLVFEKLPGAARRSLAYCLAPFSTPRLRRIRQALSAPLDDLIVQNARFIDDHAAHGLFAHDQAFLGDDRLKALQGAETTSSDPLGRLLYLDLKTYLVSLLDRQDKMSMGASIESRVPFLDYRIVEWSLSVSASKKINRFQNKYLLKRLASRYLPCEVVHRRKSGFGVPLARWLRNERGLGAYLDLLRTTKTRERGLWDTRRVERLIQEHTTGINDHNELLWELINVELWCSIYLDRKGVSPTLPLSSVRKS